MVKHNKKCEYCGKGFIARKSNAKTCSSTCRSQMSLKRRYAKRLGIQVNVKDACKDVSNVKDACKDVSNVKDVNGVNEKGGLIDSGYLVKPFDFDNIQYKEIEHLLTRNERDVVSDFVQLMFKYRCRRCEKWVSDLVIKVYNDGKMVSFSCPNCDLMIGFSSKPKRHIAPAYWSDHGINK